MFNTCGNTPLIRFCAALATLLAGASLPAMANEIRVQPDVTVFVRVVSTSDLNLAAPADQTILQLRLKAAANKICSQVLDGDGLAGNAFGICVRKVLVGADQQAQQLITAARNKS